MMDRSDEGSSVIEIRETAVFRGPSVWALVPVVRFHVDIGELEDRPTHEIPGFIDRLLAAIPTLEEHGSSPRHPGGFAGRMRDGAGMGHVLERVALELQALTGAIVTHGSSRGTGERGVYDVVVEHRQEDVGVAAGRLGVRLLNHLISGTEPGFDLTRELEGELIPLAKRRSFGPSTVAIVAEAERRGIPVLRLHPEWSMVQLGHGRHQQRVWATLTSRTPHVAVQIARDKELTNRLLRDAGIPAPMGSVARDAAAAVAAAARIGYPVVLKPSDGNHGRGVCLDLADAAAVHEHFPVAAAESRDGAVVVERFVRGKDFRILVVDDAVVAVAERVPAHVVGDGARSIAALVAVENTDPRRGVGHEKSLTRIALDAQTTETLARQGLGLDDVPAAGRVVAVKLTGNLSTGGTAIDRTDEIHPENVETALQAALTVGLDVAGIDVVTPDIGRPLREVGGAIVEINAAPGFRMHSHPTAGTPRPAGKAVVDMLFRPGAPVRVPIVAVTGTNGKTTTARMVAHIARAAGKTVGLTTTDGIYVNGRQIAAGDMAGPESARMVLKHPRVEFAVLETARGGILRSGLGFDRCNVAIVTNVTSDHLGIKGIDSLEDLARVKAVVPGSVFRDGTSVLNADDRWTVEMARSARGTVVFFGMDEANPTIQEHLRDQGRAVVRCDGPEGETLTLLEHERRTPIVPAREIPATMDGRVRANVANALAAAAAALASGVELACVRDALRGFGNSYAETPGRFNRIEIEGREVLMDYGHNVGALVEVAEFVRRTAAPRTIGVITMPGDRRDVDIREFGELAGRTFDRVVIREGTDRRGRPAGELAAIMRSGAVAAGMPEDRMTVILDELEAVHGAIDLAEPGDLVVALVDGIRKVWASLEERARLPVAPLVLSDANGAAHVDGWSAVPSVGDVASVVPEASA